MFVLLDNSSGSGPASRLFADPKAVVTADTPGEVAGALCKIEEAASHGLHAAGFLSYELGYALEPRVAALMPAGRRVPLLWFGLFEAPVELGEAEVEAFLAKAGSGGAIGPVTPGWSMADYRQRFEMAQAKIDSGDIYQLNLTFKARFQISGPPLAFYRDLRRRQPVAHGAIVDTGQITVLSLSPEQFLSRDGQTVASRPMKGTAARGATPEADARAKVNLAADPKQRAENLMIVDLVRNDLGRMAEIGSVAVSDLFTVETYRSVHQLTSGVQARLRQDVGLTQLVTALFPPGSVTGAPKIRAMELIADLESEARGVYCGAIGCFEPDLTARFNVAIRTPVIFADGNAEMGIGSAVVADSSAEAEYDECLLKMKFLTPEFQLIETLLWQPGEGYWLLDGHMERLAASARHFGFGCNDAAIRRALADAVAAPVEGHARVRLLLSHSGAHAVTVTRLAQPAANQVLRFVWAVRPVSSADPFLVHKTTSRQRYDDDWAHLAQAHGADEVLYVNEQGEVTEGSRTNIFIERGGRLLTPPVACGLLPGVLRAELLATGRAQESVLTLEDLRTTKSVFLGNSVRGLVRAEPCPDAD